MFLQPGKMRDITTLQPSTLNVLEGTANTLHFINSSSAMSISFCSNIYGIASIWTFHSIFTKDFLAVHSAVSAISMIAVAFFRAWGSILHIEIIRAGQGPPTAVLWKVTHSLNWSAECPSRRIGAVCTASACITFAARVEVTVTHTAGVAVTLFEGATVTLFALIHYVVSTTIVGKAFIEIHSVSPVHALE